METSNIIIGIVFVLIFALFIWFSNYKLNAKKRRMINTLKNFAATHGSNVLECEVINNIVFGIDNQRSKAFFVEVENDIEKSVDLQTIKKCRLNQVSRNVLTKSGRQNIVDKLELIFSPVDSNALNITLEFYNSETGDFQPNSELQFCEKWTKIINSHLSDRNKK